MRKIALANVIIYSIDILLLIIMMVSDFDRGLYCVRFPFWWLHATDYGVVWGIIVRVVELGVISLCAIVVKNKKFASEIDEAMKTDWKDII